MSVAELKSETRSAAVSGLGADVLSQILNPNVQLAVWRRPGTRLLTWIKDLDFDAIDDVQTDMTLSDGVGEISQMLVQAGYPGDPLRNVLAEEIGRYATIFGQIMDRTQLRMRLEIVETDACRKFHMDFVKARLIAPLTSPGTQWIEADAGPGAMINELGAGDVAIFKGRIWAEEPAILHRSPPIAGTGVSRLLLVLDPKDGPPVRRLP